MLYKNLGFINKEYDDSSYYWVIDNMRRYRLNYNKSLEEMYELGYYRCYDSGNLLFIKYNDKTKIKNTMNE